MVHGTADPTVPFVNALLLQSTWDDMGVPNILYDLEGAGHGPWGAAVLDADGVPQTLAELAYDFIVAQQALQVE